jgi:hypothetical protein
MLVEVAMVAWQEHKICEFPLTLEKHLKGAYMVTWRPGQYRTQHTYYKRQPLFTCRVAFNHQSQEIKIRGASFGPELFGFIDDYKSLERGVQWKAPASIIPKADQGILGNTKSLLVAPSGAVHADYSRQEKPNYGHEEKLHLKRQTYGRTESLIYMPKKEQIAAENENEGETEGS